jgi:hypothetical protein
MQQTHRRQTLLHRSLLIVLGGMLLLAGCDQAAGRLRDILYPTVTPQEVVTVPSAAPAIPTAIPTPSPSPQPTETRSLPTATALPAPSATPAPPPEEGYHLVFARRESIYRGNYYGGEAVEIASVPKAEAWDFARGFLALSDGRNVDVVDLGRGQRASWQVPSEGQVAHTEIFWGAQGQGILHLNLVSEADGSKRHLELRALAAQDGAAQGFLRLDEVAEVTLLRYDETLGQVLLIPRDGGPSFTQVARYDLKSGKLLRSWKIQGEGDPVLSPDGRYLLAEQFGAQQVVLAIYDLEANEAKPRIWQHPPDSHSVDHAWSPDGRSIAFLLRAGRAYQEAAAGLGVWVLDLASLQAHKVLEESSPWASLLGWTPDGLRIAGYHRDDQTEPYFYTVRPDGGERRILPLGPEAELLGWMPYAGPVPVSRVVIDPWQNRFSAARDAPNTLPGLVAQFVAERGSASSEALTQEVQGLLRQAGWKLDLDQPSIKRVAEGVYVAQVPPMGVYILEEGQAQAVGTGHIVLDARLEKDDLGLITGMIGASAVQPAFTLLRRQADGTWGLLWSPQGQREWIATDGEILFAGKGLELLKVAGSSFGLDEERNPFSECHACPHRRLSALWARQGDAYVRQTKLPAGASADEVWWEMTEPSPYAVLYECLRRARQGLPLGDLAKADVLTQMQTLGLLNKDARFLAEEELPRGVRFSLLGTQQRFLATVEEGKLLRIERMP